MRFINLIVVHCSATRCDRSYTEHDLTTDHLRRGFSGAGYHFYIRKNGDIKTLRPIGQPGAHVKNHNAHSVGICYEGGLDERGHPADTRTDFQKHSLRVLVMLLLRDYPGSRLCTPRPQPRPRLQRRNRTRRVDQGMPLLRCGIHSSRFCSSQPRLSVISSAFLCFSRFFPDLSGSFVM